METRRLTLAERLYLPQVVEGVAVTTRHFVRNLALHTLHLFGFARDKSAAVTTQYPEQRKPYSEGYRGAHRLTIKPDGSVRCTACFLCATACPAKCIHIEAGEHPNAGTEKDPAGYEKQTLQRLYWRKAVGGLPGAAIRQAPYRLPRACGRGGALARVPHEPLRRGRGLKAMAKTYKQIMEEARQVVPEVSPDDVQGKLAAATHPLLLDVREKEEFRQGYVPGALS